MTIFYSDADIGEVAKTYLLKVSEIDSNSRCSQLPLEAPKIM